MKGLEERIRIPSIERAAHGSMHQILLEKNLEEKSCDESAPSTVQWRRLLTSAFTHTQYFSRVASAARFAAILLDVAHF